MRSGADRPIRRLRGATVYRGDEIEVIRDAVVTADGSVGALELVEPVVPEGPIWIVHRGAELALSRYYCYASDVWLWALPGALFAVAHSAPTTDTSCLLYTSDAADE